MLKKLAVIGLTTALIGCGTSNRALADAGFTDAFTKAPSIDYTKIFNERTMVMGVLHFLKEKPYKAPVNKTPVFFNHATQDAQIDKMIQQFPHSAFDVRIKAPTYPNQNRRTYMKLDFTVGWNKNYLNQLYTAVSASSNPGGKGFAKFIYKRHWTTPGYDVQLDMTSSNKLMRGLYRAGPQLLVRVGNRSLGCYNVPELSGLTQGRMAQHKMVQPNGNGTIINGWLEFTTSIQFEITPDDDIGNVRIFVVNQNQCR